MYIVAIAWIYVVLMMSVTENSVVAGVMTFVFYGLLPVAVILYLMGTPQRKRNRQARENKGVNSVQGAPSTPQPTIADDAAANEAER